MNPGSDDDDDADDDAVEDLQRAAEDVEVAVRDRVESAGIDCAALRIHRSSPWPLPASAR